MTNPHDRSAQLPATRSESLPAWLPKLTETLNQTCAAGDFLRQFARLAANYGDSRIATPEQRGLLLREWQEAFAHHAPEHLHEAVSAVMKACKFWPTLAEMNDQLAHIRREAIAAVDAATGRTSFKADAGGFCQAGRTQVEEIAHRAAQVAKWKTQYGFDRLLQPDAPTLEPRAASQDAGITQALQATQDARRARGEIL